MAYSTTNPPAQIAARVGSGGGSFWSYKSTDTVATVAGSSYFSNGHALGLKVADGMLVVQLSTAGAFTAFNYACVSSVTVGAGAAINSVSSST